MTTWIVTLGNMETAATNASTLPDTSGVNKPAGHIATRKIWLPKLLYSALPYFYILAGIVALLATFYVSEWFWIVPHYLIFSIFCIHIGIYVFRLRRH